MSDKLSIGIFPDGNRRWAKKVGRSVEQAYVHSDQVGVGIVLTAMGLKQIERIVFYTLSHENARFRPPSEIEAILIATESLLLDIMGLPNISIQFIGDRSIPWVSELHKKFSVKGTGLQVVFLATYSAAWDLEPTPIRSASIPPLDFIIRTGGDTRLSGFLPWQSAYAQFFFTKTLWPDFTNTEFLRILRRYGKIRASGISGA